MIDRTAIAHHEAGHAAVDVYFDHAIDGVSIEAAGERLGFVQVDREGHDELRYEDPLQKQVVFERMIMAALAGAAAQHRHAPGSVDDESLLGDQRLVDEYMEALEPENDAVCAAWLRLLQLRTEALVADLWPRIQRIAEALISRGSLTPEEVRSAFVDPDRAAALGGVR